MIERIELTKEEFELVTRACRDLATVAKAARLETMRQGLLVAEAEQAVRAVLLPLAERYGFDADGRYDLDFAKKELVAKEG